MTLQHPFPSGIFDLTHDGNHVMRGTSMDILEYFVRHTSFSLEYNLQYEGYSVNKLTIQNLPRSNPREV
ncbi:hypothetical protein LCGC14_0146290 [marine sediment metagenome]|uniref:Uncharacterized protein n=1 Tax=marine sediment metagenome TaxID=412755 RepID=A0A0F9Y1F7_9ZZZZ